MRIVLFILGILMFLFGMLGIMERANANEGKRLYITNCARCHNLNPTKPGTIGPDLFTTPLNVIRTKVPTGTYPSGYVPKRRTKVMPKFPGLTDKVDFIYNYIQSFKSKTTKS